MSQRNFIVYGNVSFPLQIRVRAASKEEAAKYAYRVLNDQDVSKCEIEVETVTGKTHLVICDTFKFRWLDSAEE